jgi:hypothetical protein
MTAVDGQHGNTESVRFQLYRLLGDALEQEPARLDPGYLNGPAVVDKAIASAWRVVWQGKNGET